MPTQCCAKKYCVRDVIFSQNYCCYCLWIKETKPVNHYCDILGVIEESGLWEGRGERHCWPGCQSVLRLKIKGVERKFLRATWGGGGSSPMRMGVWEIFVNLYLKNDFLYISKPYISYLKLLESYNYKKRGWRIIW